MISLSKSLARKYGRDGVLVNSVLPGLIHTANVKRAANEIAEASEMSSEQVIANNGRGVPAEDTVPPRKLQQSSPFFAPKLRPTLMVLLSKWMVGKAGTSKTASDLLKPTLQHPHQVSLIDV